MIKLRWKDRFIEYEKIEWSGTDTQCSREIAFTIPCNPYDKEFENQEINLGDLIFLYSNAEQIFVGTVTDREKTAEIGTASYTAMDFMHHLLRSNGSYKFTKTTPEKITKKVCADVGVKTGTLEKTKCNIPKAYLNDQSIYDIIVYGYRKAKAKTGKKYMPIMEGQKVSVIQKGKPSGVALIQGEDITEATYSDTTSNMVNIIEIYNDKLKKIGKVQNKNNVTTYGKYRATIMKEKGVNAKKQAKALMVGVTQEATIKAIGDIRAISGRSVEIRDEATGLTGTFYITSDKHTFERGIHTMELGISWKNEMEEGAETENEKNSNKKKLTNSAKCYYLDNATVYHSSSACSALKNKNPKKSTVTKIKKVKIKTGKNKGKRKYKPCSKCWET